MKKISLLFMALIIFAWSLLSGFTLPEHTGNYANDFAGVLSEQTEQYINETAKKLKDETKAEVAVATVTSLDGADIETYSIQLARKWGIGDSNKNNGILILLAIEDRKVRIEVGNGLEGAINDGKAGRMLRQYANPYFSDDKWNEGITNLYAAVIKEVYNEYGIEYEDSVISGLVESESTEIPGGIGLVIAIIIFTIVSPVISFLIRRRRRRMYGYDYDIFNDRDRGFFGGGFGSSGSSGGGFSFGGGSFSGGGASSSF